MAYAPNRLQAPRLGAVLLTAYLFTCSAAICSLATCSLTTGNLGAQDPQPTADNPWQPYLAGKAPSTAELPGLLTQLTALLGSPNPALRDDTAYTLLSRWILREGLVDDDGCRNLLTVWTNNLSHQLEATATATPHDALLRSFSALSLALLVARDNQTPYLDAKSFAALVTQATHYLTHEPDERGYDSQLGWVHASAHGADLIRQLAKSERLQPAQQMAMLTSIAERLQGLQLAFTAGEDDRLARAIVELVQRDDFEMAQLKSFLTGLANLPNRSRPEHWIALEHNRRLLVQALLVRLLLDARQSQQAKDGVALLQEALQGKLRQR